MKRTLEVLNDLERDGIIRRYALGGAIAALFYVEPFETEDLDVFVLLNTDAHPLTPLAPLYEELRRRGYPEDGVHVEIEGVPVQFLPPYNELIAEALAEARDVPYETTFTRVPLAEHLIAIMVQTGRAKDRLRVLMFREQVTFDETRLLDILTRYALQERYAAWIR